MNFQETFIFASPKSIHVIYPTTFKEQLQFLLDSAQYSRALLLSQSEAPDLVLEIGESYIMHLFDEKDYEKMHDVFPVVLGTNKELWEKWCWALIGCLKIHVSLL